MARLHYHVCDTVILDGQMLEKTVSVEDYQEEQFQEVFRKIPNRSSLSILLFLLYQPLLQV
jgi:hypothetical protein